MKEVSIQPKPKTGLEETRLSQPQIKTNVSIQPKPKTDLEVFWQRLSQKTYLVSIQPKPKTGLEEEPVLDDVNMNGCLNPAEAEDGFRSLINNSFGSYICGSQSSRSRRRV